jgi:hypothetical protein
MTASTITSAQTWLAFALPLLLAGSFSPALAANRRGNRRRRKREGEVVECASMNWSEECAIGEFENATVYVKVKLQSQRARSF